MHGATVGEGRRKKDRKYIESLKIWWWWWWWWRRGRS